MTANSSNGRSASNSTKFQSDGLIKTVDESAIKIGDRLIGHDDFLKDIGMMFFLLPQGFREVCDSFGEFFMSDLVHKSKYRSADFVVQRFDGRNHILGECKIEIITPKIITETTFERHYRKVYQIKTGHKADIWYLSPVRPHPDTFKLLKNMNLENDHDDKIMTYSEFTELVLAKLRKWGKSSGKQDEASHASREIHKKCKLLFKQV